MVKRVNIKAQVAIKTVTPPIYGTLSNVRMTTSDILKCLCKRAIVEEILSDGRVIRLGMKNYYIDNEAIYVKKTPVEEKPVEKAEEPVVIDNGAPSNIVSEVDLEDAADALPEVVSEPNIVDEAENNTVLHEYNEEESTVEEVADEVEESEEEEATEEVEEEVVAEQQTPTNTQNNNNYNHNRKKKKHR